MSSTLKGITVMTVSSTDKTETTKTTAPPGMGSDGQTFLVGETLYLRGIELTDAKYVRSWRFAPFPINAERAEEILKKEIPGDGRGGKRWLLVARRADDVPVGSVTWSSWNWQQADIQVHPDPLLSPAARSAFRVEVFGLLVPYLVHEREFMSLGASIPDGDPVALQAALAAGFEEVGRLREAVLADGQRRDDIQLEALHPGWIKTLGDPRLGDAAFREMIAAQRAEFAARPPVRRRIGSIPADQIPADIPPTAIAVGERIYIRPLEPDDADDMAAWSRKEPETFFDNGRGLMSGILMAKHIRDLAEDDLPDSLRFAVVLRDGDVFIGANGVEEIDWLNRTAETESFFHRPDYRGNGYGTEAKHLLLEFVFERLGLHMVRSFVWQPNGRSAAALRKQGYRDAGIFHWDGFKNAVSANALMFDFLATEWRARRDAANG